METNLTENNFNHWYWTAGVGQRLWLFFTKPFLLFFLHFQVIGKENLKGLPNGIVFASNHISNFDGELLSESLGLFSEHLPLYYVSKEKGFYSDNMFQLIFYSQAMLHFVGAYSALFGVKDYEKSLAQHIHILKNKKKNVHIFVEGHKSLDGQLLRAKGGVVALSKYSNAPIIPISISGNLHITLKEFLLRKRFVIVRYGKPIFPEELFTGYENAQPQEFTQIANEKIITKISELLLKSE